MCSACHLLFGGGVLGGGEAVEAVVRGAVGAGLGGEDDGVGADLEDAVGAEDAGDLGGVGALGEAYVDGDGAVGEEGGLDVGHVAAVLPAVDAAYGVSLVRDGVDAGDALGSAEEVDHEVAGHAGAVGVEAAPAVKGDGIEGLLGDGALPGVPVEVCGGEVGDEGYCHAPWGELRPSWSSTWRRSPTAP